MYQLIGMLDEYVNASAQTYNTIVNKMNKGLRNIRALSCKNSELLQQM